jgi:hypothetical protein
MLSNDTMKPADVLRCPKWLAGIGMGGVLLGVAVSSALSGNEGESAAPARALDLEPGRFVITETSWGTDPTEPEAADPEADADDWLETGEETNDQETKERLAEQARDRWQNLDIAIRGR